MTTAHAEPNYMGVFWWLLALTVLEIAVIYMDVARLIIVILLVGMAVSKAALVASLPLTITLALRRSLYDGVLCGQA